VPFHATFQKAKEKKYVGIYPPELLEIDILRDIFQERLGADPSQCMWMNWNAAQRIHLVERRTASHRNS
jgi:hypothetical protein